MAPLSPAGCHRWHQPQQSHAQPSLPPGPTGHTPPAHPTGGALMALTTCWGPASPQSPGACDRLLTWVCCLRIYGSWRSPPPTQVSLTVSKLPRQLPHSPPNPPHALCSQGGSAIHRLATWKDTLYFLKRQMFSSKMTSLAKKLLSRKLSLALVLVRRLQAAM